jgi:hypothetical protein
VSISFYILVQYTHQAVRKWCFLLFMVLLVPLLERLSHIVGKFRDVLSKSQFENFQSVMFGLIVSHCKEHDVKSIRAASKLLHAELC